MNVPGNVPGNVLENVLGNDYGNGHEKEDGNDRERDREDESENERVHLLRSLRANRVDDDLNGDLSANLGSTHYVQFVHRDGVHCALCGVFALSDHAVHGVSAVLLQFVE